MCSYSKLSRWQVKFCINYLGRWAENTGGRPTGQKLKLLTLTLKMARWEPHFLTLDLVWDIDLSIKENVNKNDSEIDIINLKWNKHGRSFALIAILLFLMWQRAWLWSKSCRSWSKNTLEGGSFVIFSNKLQFKLKKLPRQEEDMFDTYGIYARRPSSKLDYGSCLILNYSIRKLHPIISTFGAPLKEKQEYSSILF